MPDTSTQNNNAFELIGIDLLSYKPNTTPGKLGTLLEKPALTRCVVARLIPSMFLSFQRELFTPELQPDSISFPLNGSIALVFLLTSALLQHAHPC